MEQQYSQFQFQAEFPSQEKPRKNFLVWILIPIIVLGIGTLGILAARIWDPLWNPFRPRPEKVLERMVLKMKETKTLESEANLFLEVVNEGVFSIEVKGHQKEDKREPENPKSETSFEISFIGRPQTRQGEPSFGLGGKIFLAGETRSLNKKSFLKLTAIPSATELGMMGINLLSLKNQWIKVDNESISEFLETFLDSLSGLAKEELPPGMVESYKIQLKQKIKEQEELQKEVEGKIKKEIENSVFGGKLFVVKKQLPDEKIDNFLPTIIL